MEWENIAIYTVAYIVSCTTVSWMWTFPCGWSGKILQWFANKTLQLFEKPEMFPLLPHREWYQRIAEDPCQLIQEIFPIILVSRVVAVVWTLVMVWATYLLILNISGMSSMK